MGWREAFSSWYVKWDRTSGLSRVWQPQRGTSGHWRQSGASLAFDLVGLDSQSTSQGQ